MFIVTLNYIVDLDVVDKHLNDHIAFLNKNYQSNNFLASGRKVPRTGGVILVDVDSRETLDKILSEDPFNINSVANYEITEFIPTKTSTQLSFLKQDN